MPRLPTPSNILSDTTYRGRLVSAPQVTQRWPRAYAESAGVGPTPFPCLLPVAPHIGPTTPLRCRLWRVGCGGSSCCALLRVVFDVIYRIFLRFRQCSWLFADDSCRRCDKSVFRDVCSWHRYRGARLNQQRSGVCLDWGDMWRDTSITFSDPLVATKRWLDCYPPIDAATVRSLSLPIIVAACTVFPRHMRHPILFSSQPVLQALPAQSTW
jgi:hypothetical protein